MPRLLLPLLTFVLLLSWPCVAGAWDGAPNRYRVAIDKAEQRGVVRLLAPSVATHIALDARPGRSRVAGKEIVDGGGARPCGRCRTGRAGVLGCTKRRLVAAVGAELDLNAYMVVNGWARDWPRASGGAYAD